MKTPSHKHIVDIHRVYDSDEVLPLKNVVCRSSMSYEGEDFAEVVEDWRLWSSAVSRSPKMPDKNNGEVLRSGGDGHRSHSAA